MLLLITSQERYAPTILVYVWMPNNEHGFWGCDTSLTSSVEQVVLPAVAHVFQRKLIFFYITICIHHHK